MFYLVCSSLKIYQTVYQVKIFITILLSDDKEKPTHIRFLVSNTAAGSIIGKGGASINEIQSQSGARIQLSRNNECFPGTSDRIIMISGSFDEVIRAMELILEKLVAEVSIM